MQVELSCLAGADRDGAFKSRAADILEAEVVRAGREAEGDASLGVGVLGEGLSFDFG